MPHARPLATIALVSVAALAGCSGDDAADGPGAATTTPVADGPKPAQWLVDVTDSVGLTFVHESGGNGSFVLPEVMGAGVGLFDADGDGDLDLYCTNGHAEPDQAGRSPLSRNRLYRQEADGSFTDVSAASGLDDGGYGMGLAVGDIDNDGDVDLYLTNYGPDRLYRNRGDGTFEDITDAAGIDVPGWSCSAAFFDYDRDGFLDLYVTQYVEHDATRKCFDKAGRPDYCGPLAFPPVSDVLLRNAGDGTFEDVSARIGIETVRGAGLGVAAADLSGNGWSDLYVANDAYANNLWVNRGTAPFTDAARMMGAAYNFMGQAEAGMGVVAADMDNDATLDLFVTHLDMETNTLYRRDAYGGFADATGPSGLGGPSMRRTGFGVGAVDLELDGDLDLLVANGRVTRGEAQPSIEMPPPWDLFAEPNDAFLNDGGGTFGPHAGALADFTDPVEITRGLATGDIDNDGDIDVLIGNVQWPARLYRNEAPRSGGWLIVDAVDPALRRAAIGAVVEIRTGNRRQLRLISRCGSYNSSRDPRAHFGLGDASRVDAILVTWPGGGRERFAGVDADPVLVLERGTGEAAP